VELNVIGDKECKQEGFAVTDNLNLRKAAD
jgi:hypothetical protein